MIIGGDFNCTTALHERQGGSGSLHADSGSCVNLINSNGLVDLGFSRQRFTWSRGNCCNKIISKRLDRILMNVEGWLLWPDGRVRHLARYSSDHSPLLLELSPNITKDKKKRPFRFEAAWLSHPQFNEVLNNNWREEISVPTALKSLKDRLII